MKLLIKNGHIVDPANKVDAVCDILVDGAKIAKVSKAIKDVADKTIDAAGKIVMPGIVDMHTHLREPGREDKETVSSATRAGLKGGVTSVLAMPNTNPAIDCTENIKLLKGIIKNTAHSNVLIAAAITKGRLGKELTDVAALEAAGAVAISDDGVSVDSDELMLQALKLAEKHDILVICHCIDEALAAGGVVNLGLTSTRMGLRGISKESEYKRVQRDIQLAQIAGARIHIAHVSCAESVEIIRKAKKKGIRVTAEATPHHIFLTEKAVLAYDTNMKMNPPLRSDGDVVAIKQGLRDGTIDAIASDHAPHTENEKEIEFDRAEFGVVGLETLLSVVITELVKPGILNWLGLVKKLALNPANILSIAKGTLSAASDADIIILSPDAEWTVEKEGLICKSKNSAFLGKRLNGLVEYTIFSGKVAYQAKQ